MEEDERDRKKREGGEEKKKKREGDKKDEKEDEEVGELLKASDIEKFKKLPSNLTLSILSPELNKSF